MQLLHYFIRGIKIRCGTLLVLSVKPLAEVSAGSGNLMIVRIQTAAGSSSKISATDYNIAAVVTRWKTIFQAKGVVAGQCPGRDQWSNRKESLGQPDGDSTCACARSADNILLCGNVLLLQRWVHFEGETPHLFELLWSKGCPLQWVIAIGDFQPVLVEPGSSYQWFSSSW